VQSNMFQYINFVHYQMISARAGEFKVDPPNTLRVRLTSRLVS
jgi:hypothetical protein